MSLGKMGLLKGVLEFVGLCTGLAVLVWVYLGFHPEHPTPGQPCTDRYEVSNEWDNPLLCLGGKWLDSCKLASYAASEAQDEIDRFESFFDNKPETEEEKRAFYEKGLAIIKDVEDAYGVQEMLSAVCENREVKIERWPSWWGVKREGWGV